MQYANQSVVRRMVWAAALPGLVALLGLASPRTAWGIPRQRPRNRCQTVDKSLGFPICIVRNSYRKNSDVRRMFVLVGATFFTEENLKRAVRHLASEFAKPTSLTITAFSDRGVLDRAIDVTIFPGQFPVDGHISPEDQARYFPKPTGYFRAYYRRGFETGEHLRHSPDPEKPDDIEVSLRIALKTGRSARSLGSQHDSKVPPSVLPVGIAGVVPPDVKASTAGELRVPVPPKYVPISGRGVSGLDFGVGVCIPGARRGLDFEKFYGWNMPKNGGDLGAGFVPLACEGWPGGLLVLADARVQVLRPSQTPSDIIVRPKIQVLNGDGRTVSAVSFEFLDRHSHETFYTEPLAVTIAPGSDYLVDEGTEFHFPRFPTDTASLTIRIARVEFSDGSEWNGAPFSKADCKADSRPYPAERPEAIYTDAARRNAVRGSVHMKVLVCLNGTVDWLLVTKGLPYGLNQNAVLAARKLIFTPATRNGIAVDCWVDVDVEFAPDK
jgi:TonB family protein